MKDENQGIELISQILWRCTVLGFMVIVIWYIAAVSPGNLICKSQGAAFGLDVQTCNMLNYSGIALTKILVLLFFFFPWLAIKQIQHKRRRLGK